MTKNLISNSSNIIWIIWEKQQRGNSLSKKLNIPYFEILSHKKGLLRYIDCFFKSLILINLHKPHFLVITNPSIILNSVAQFLKLWFKFELIVDFHNAGIYPNEGQNKLVQKWANFLIKKASVAIITNRFLFDHVTKLGGNPIIIPDPLPEIPTSKNATSFIQNKSDFNVLLIRGGGKDESIDLTNQLILQIPADSHIKFFISGKNNNHLLKSEMVTHTGFLSESEYNELINFVDCVLVLSTRKDNLMCGAYEAVSVGKPLIASDSEVIRWYFKAGTYYTNNTAADILKGIYEIKSNSELYAKQINLLKNELELNWATFTKPLLNFIQADVKAE